MFVMQLSLKAFQGLHQTFSWHGYIRCSFLKTFKCLNLHTHTQKNA